MHKSKQLSRPYFRGIAFLILIFVLLLGAEGYTSRVKPIYANPLTEVAVWFSSETNPKDTAWYNAPMPITYQLAQQTGITFAPPNNSSQPVITVNPAITYQTMEGIGSSLEESTIYNLMLMSPAKREEILRALVDPAQGIGMDMMRISLGASDFTAQTFYSYNDMPAGQTDPNLDNFSIQQDIDLHIIEILQQALSYNPDLKFIMSPWSPPGWMKTTDSLIGGTLKPEYTQVAARYYARSIAAYEALGIPIYAITPQNEPQYLPPDYPGMILSAEQERDLVIALRSELDALGLDTKIIAYDHNFQDGFNYISTILNDPAAYSAVYGSGFHGYGGTPAEMTAVHNAYPNKEIFFTERTYWGVEGMSDITDIFRNWSSTYNGWVTMLDSNIQPEQWSGVPDPTMLIQDASNRENYWYTPEYYLVGQFSKFVQTGGSRIDSSLPDNGATLNNVAFLNPDNTVVLVVTNRSNTPQSFTVVTQGQQFNATIPEKTVATYRWEAGASSQSAYPAGIPHAIPGQIEAEDYDTGGTGVAYFDSDTGNQGNTYRIEDVDIESSSDTNGGHNVGWIADGEWLEYTTNVAYDGLYRVDTRIASQIDGGAFQLEVDGVDVTGPITVNGTGGWQSWATVTGPTISLAAGEHLLRIMVVTGGFNLNWLSFTALTPPPTPTPDPNGVVYAINAGGSGYVAADGTQYSADAYYSDGATGSSSNGINGTTDDTLYQSERYGVNGATIAYDLPVNSGTYDLQLQFAEFWFTNAGERLFDIYVEGALVTNNLDLISVAGPNTAYDVQLTAISVTDGNLDLDFVPVLENAKVNAFVITQGDTLPPPTPTPSPTPNPNQSAYPSGLAHTVPGRIEAENYDNGDSGEAYNDSDAGNNGNAYRTDDVDVEGSADTGGGYNVGWIADGEWLEYTVDVTTPGTYSLAARVASAANGGLMRVEFNGVNKTGEFAFPNTGGWQNWVTVNSNNFTLAAGTTVMRVNVVGGGFNLNWLELTREGATLPYQDASLPNSVRVDDLLARMTLDEKIGQMTQAERLAFANINDVASYHIGSILSGGGSLPDPNTPTGWADMVDTLQTAAMSSRLGIPIIYGVDAVHGHNNVYGATIFPHNIGLGATHNPLLVQEVGAITAKEMMATGVPWTFSPCVCVARDERWGRTYESFGEDPELAVMMSTMITGYQGSDLSAPDTVLATAKHFIGDGGTTWGSSTNGTYQIDQGDAQISEAELRAIHLPPFIAAVDAGVGAIMPSYSSWNGQKMHSNSYLLTTVLKGELGFEGFVISDWAAIDQIPGDYNSDTKTAINAGVDMVMVPYDYALFINTLRAEVQAGNVSQARIDDAVRRILTKKFELGLFDRPYTDRTTTDVVGSAVHRDVARQAVRESLVLLKNDNNILPLAPNSGQNILVAGRHGNDIGLQSGGWTISWQGQSGNITPGTTIFEGMQAVASGSTQVSYSTAPSSTELNGYDLGIVVVGEDPYAEGVGDNADLTLSAADSTLVAQVCGAMPCVVVLISGRPLIVNNELAAADAFVAAWLPGTEGDGISEVLFGSYNFSGTLPMSWPTAVTQLPLNVYDTTYAPLYPYGYGLTYP